MSTFNELVTEALNIAYAERETSYGEPARCLALSITHLEDALTRYNKAQHNE